MNSFGQMPLLHSKQPLTEKIGETPLPFSTALDDLAMGREKTQDSFAESRKRESATLYIEEMFLSDIEQIC